MRSETKTSSSAWLRSAQRTGVSSGTLSPAVVTVCVRGLMLVPENSVTGSMMLVLNVASTVGRYLDRACCRIDSARRMPAAACWTVGWLFTARWTASSNVTVSSTCAAGRAGRPVHTRNSSNPMCLCMGRHRRLAGNQGPHDHVQNRDEEDVEERREEHPARDRGTDGMTSLLPGAAGEDERHHAEDEGERRHQDGP